MGVISLALCHPPQQRSPGPPECCSAAGKSHGCSHETQIIRRINNPPPAGRTRAELHPHPCVPSQWVAETMSGNLQNICISVTSRQGRTSLASKAAEISTRLWAVAQERGAVHGGLAARLRPANAAGSTSLRQSRIASLLAANTHLCYAVRPVGLLRQY
jgi:hypothetical protein